MSVPGPAPLEFVELEEHHLDEIMPIEVEAYPEPWTRGMFRSELRSARSHFYVAFLDDLLVGYGGFWLVLDEAHITSVTVRKGYRRRGLGRQLLSYLLGVAGDLGARTVTLEVRANNLDARNLYLSMGFELVGVREGYYSKTNEDAIVMLKELG